jgi:hypothetical protein
MPLVNGKHFGYDKKGIKKAMRAMEERSEKKGFSKEEISLAMKKLGKK